MEPVSYRWINELWLFYLKEVFLFYCFGNHLAPDSIETLIIIPAVTIQTLIRKYPTNLETNFFSLPYPP